MADQALRPPDRRPATPVAPLAAAAAPPGAQGAAPTRAALRALGPGQALDGTARAAAEAGFGQDFGAVRIHDDGPAHAAAAALRARAFTLGPDIYFARGRYRPQAGTGRRLLAHELAHALQQRRAPGAVIQRDADDGVEAASAEADPDPRREILGLAAFDRRYPGLLAVFNTLGEAIAGLHWTADRLLRADVGLAGLRDRYTRAHGRWEEADAQLDRFWSIARVMLAVARAEQVLAVVHSMQSTRARSTAPAFGVGIADGGVLDREHAQALRAWRQVNGALAHLPETAAVHAAVAEELETLHDGAVALSADTAGGTPRSAAETLDDLLDYLREHQAALAAGDRRLQFGLGIARLLFADFGERTAAYRALFAALAAQGADLQALALQDGATIGYLADMGVHGLEHLVRRDGAAAAAEHMLLGAWDFDEASGAELDAPGWALLLDVLVGVVPGVGQLADVRDVSGSFYRLGRYPDQRENGWLYVGLAASLIGFIPVAGDGAKSLLAAMRRAVDAVPVGRLSNEVVALVARQMDAATLARVLDAGDDFTRLMTLRWTVLQGQALNLWDRLADALGPVLVNVSDLTQAELRLAQGAVADHLPEALRVAGISLGQFVRSAWVTARLSMVHEAADLLAMVREYRDTWSLAADAAQELWSPTARFLARLEPAERAAVQARLLELAAADAGEVADGVRQLLDGEAGAAAHGAEAPPAAATASGAPAAELPAAAAASELEPVAMRPPTPGAGRGVTIRHDEMLRLFTQALRRPGPGGDVYRIYDGIESYDDAYRALTGDLMGELPMGFVHEGLIHLPPRSDTVTVLHETLHWASEQSGARVLLGPFVEEGLVETIARRIDRSAATPVYEANTAFVDELAQVVGADLLDAALLHGQWSALRSALRRHFDSAADTQAFYALLRRIHSDGTPAHLVDRARHMLGVLVNVPTVPHALLPPAP